MKAGSKNPLQSFKRRPVAWLFVCLGLILFLQVSAQGAEFAVYDVLIDPAGKPLAAYQLKIRASGGNPKIISVEGGEHPAFKDAPHYDPNAIQKNVIKIAAFNTETAEKLPRQTTRVATLHIQFDDAAPRFEVEVQAAAIPGGSRIEADAFVQRRKTEN